MVNSSRWKSKVVPISVVFFLQRRWKAYKAAAAVKGINASRAYKELSLEGAGAASADTWTLAALAAATAM